MKFLIGNEQVFLGFLDSIKKEDKIAILTHTDLDGIASSIFLEKILESKGLKVSFLDFFGYKPGMLDDLSIKLNKKNITKVFLTDLNVDGNDLVGFEKLRKNFNILLIDHHPPNPNLETHVNIIKNHSEDCSAWVLYNFAKKFFNICEWNWLVCAAMVEEWSFKDNDNLEFLKSKCKDIKDEDPFDSEPGRISEEISYALKFNKDAKKIYNSIKKNDMKEIKRTSAIVSKEIDKNIAKFKENAEYYKDKNLYFYYGKPKFDIGNIVATKLSKQNKGIYCYASNIDNKRIRISFRNNLGEEDVSEIVKNGIKGLEDAEGGGHKRASALSIRTQDLEKFKENTLK